MALLIAGSALIGALLVMLYVFSPFKRPLPTESDWTTHRTPWWQIYYSSKYIAPVKVPAYGSELDKMFVSDMRPHPPNDGFAKETSMVIGAVGDLMCRRDMQGAAGEHLWDLIGNDLFSADLKIGNLEFAVNREWQIDKLIRYSVAGEVAEPLLGDTRFGRFDLVSLGNNHVNDSLSGGIVATCDFLESRSVGFVGANRSPAEQDRIPLYVRNGIRIAVLSYTFSTNGVPLDDHFKFGVNLVRFNALDDADYDESMIKKHVASARAQGADVVVACLHWGVEFEYYPPVRIVNRAHGLLDAGVDIILGHHPHVLNPSERYVASDGRETIVCYSLGSLTTYALLLPIMRLSHMVKISLHAGRDGNGKRIVRIADVSFMPVFHSMNKINGSMIHRLVPVMQAVELMKSGKPPQYLSRRDKAALGKLYREHAKYFLQQGFTYI